MSNLKIILTSLTDNSIHIVVDNYSMRCGFEIPPEQFYKYSDELCRFVPNYKAQSSLMNLFVSGFLNGNIIFDLNISSKSNIIRLSTHNDDEITEYELYVSNLNIFYKYKGIIGKIIRTFNKKNNPYIFKLNTEDIVKLTNIFNECLKN